MIDNYPEYPPDPDNPEDWMDDNYDLPVVGKRGPMQLGREHARDLLEWSRTLNRHKLPLKKWAEERGIDVGDHL